MHSYLLGHSVSRLWGMLDSEIVAQALTPSGDPTIVHQ